MLSILLSVDTNGVADTGTSSVPIEGTDTFTFYFEPAYYNLQPQLNLYFEQKLYPEQVSFQPALNYDCATPGLVFPEELTHQVIRLPMNREEDHVYSFYLPEVCDIDLLSVSYNVDKVVTQPAFISGSKVTTPEGNFYRIVFANSLISDADAGTYNIGVTLTLATSPVQSVTKYFILHIYPETQYGSDVDSFACENKYSFMSYGDVVGNIYSHVDLDTVTLDYVLCGANKLASNDGTYTSFLQYNTVGHAVMWHINIEAGVNNNIGQFCQISPQIANLEDNKIIYTVINSQNFVQTPESIFNSSIYVFQQDRKSVV